MSRRRTSGKQRKEGRPYFLGGVVSTGVDGVALRSRPKSGVSPVGPDPSDSLHIRNETVRVARGAVGDENGGGGRGGTIEEVRGAGQ